MSAFVDTHRDRFGVEPMCREIEASASAYRARRTRPPSVRAVRDEYLIGEIKRVHKASDGIYGQLKIWDELNEEGIVVARCTVERLMRTNGIEGCRNGKTQVTTTPGSNPVAADDLVQRDFTADRPDAVWLSDFTYIRTWQGWSYLAIVLDVYTRRIVGWQLASHMGQSLVTDALDMAIAARQEHEGGLIAHSDNGAVHVLRIHRAPEEGRHRPEPRAYGHRLGQCDGGKHHVHTQARTHQTLYVEDQTRPRTRARDLHRLVQRPAPAPQTHDDEERGHETAGTPASARAVQSGSRPGDRGFQIIEPTWNPGRFIDRVQLRPKHNRAGSCAYPCG